MLVRLTKKLADVVDGIDLTHCQEGDVIDLPARHARLLMAEGWAEVLSSAEVPSCTPVLRARTRAVAADRAGYDDSVAGKLRQYLSGASSKPKPGA